MPPGPRRGGAHAAVRRSPARPRRRGPAPGRLPARRRGCLVGLIALEFGGERGVVVGQQPQPGVAEVGLDHRRLAGDLGLPPERLEPASDLRGQVNQPGQVGLHRLELAQRLLLAPAVLEDPGGLLDQRPPRVGAGVQHLIELALAHDHVHLPAQAGVGEQFLHVEQAALVPVDRVLALPGPEQQPADRDLGVVDRQRPVAVVDGQRDLGPAQRRPSRGPGEHDVLHLAAAQRFDALLAHDPGERVDHVGLARPVRADDTGDPLLELQRGGRGEGLEPAQSERFQVHLSALLLWDHATRRRHRALATLPPALRAKRPTRPRTAAALVRTLPCASVSPVDSGDASPWPARFIQVYEAGQAPGLSRRRPSVRAFPPTVARSGPSTLTGTAPGPAGHDGTSGAKEGTAGQEGTAGAREAA